MVMLEAQHPISSSSLSRLPSGVVADSHPISISRGCSMHNWTTVYPDSVSNLEEVKEEIELKAILGHSTPSVHSPSSSDYAELKPLPYDYVTTKSPIEPETSLTKFDAFVGDNGDNAAILRQNLIGDRNVVTSVSDVTSSNCSTSPNPNAAAIPAKVETIDFTPNQDEFDDLASIVGLSMGNDALLSGSADSSDLDLDTWIETTAQTIKPLLTDNSLEQLLPSQPRSVGQLHSSDGSTLQSLLLVQQPAKVVAASPLASAPYSILQNRLQQGQLGTSNVKMESNTNVIVKGQVNGYGSMFSDAMPHSTMPDFGSRGGGNSAGRSKGGGGGGGRAGKSKRGVATNSTTPTAPKNGGQESGRKLMHYCHICHRGFLNKSNIKVHLRTHTGEKPFKCEHCTKAFRQKAHLLKHMSIHKRISRD